MEQETALAVLTHPDPDPDDIALADQSGLDALSIQAETASHLCRAIVRQSSRVEALKARMEQDIAAWQAEIAKQESWEKSWRTIIRDWMQRTGTTQIKTPWFTASLSRPRTRIVVDDEEAAIETVKRIGYAQAVKTVEKLVKSEFDAAYNGRPEAFAGIAHEETGEPGLTIRKAKE